MFRRRLRGKGNGSKRSGSNNSGSRRSGNRSNSLISVIITSLAGIIVNDLRKEDSVIRKILGNRFNKLKKPENTDQNKIEKADFEVIDS